jgi:FkbM family methyltransferase
MSIEIQTPEQVNANRRLAKSPVRKALSLLPEKMKSPIRRIVDGEPSQFPALVNTTFEGIGVKFRVTNVHDWHRAGNIFGYEGVYAQIIVHCMKQQGSSGVLLNAGASIGIYTALAAGVGMGKVIGVEPHRESYEELQFNMELNANLDTQVSLYRCALGGKNDKTTIYTAGDSSFAPSLERTTSELVKPEQVASLTLDYMLSFPEVYSPTMLVVDVEGAEELLLRGGERLLNSPDKPSDLFIELHGVYLQRHFSSNIERVLALIAEFGYQKEYKQFRNGGAEMMCHFRAKGK